MTAGADRGAGRRRRSKLVPRNMFFVRLHGRVSALLVGRNGEVRVQDDPASGWRLHRVTGACRRTLPWRLELVLDDGSQLVVSVYAGREADRLQVGRAGVRRPRRPRTYRERREAADRLRDMLTA